MSSIRSLKKELGHLASATIDTALVARAFNPKISEELIERTIGQVIDAYDQAIVNIHAGKKGGDRKVFREVAEEVDKKMEGLLAEICS